MKKYIAFLLCIVMIISMFSCQLNDDPDDLPSNENSDSTKLNNDSTNDSSTVPDISADSITNTTSANYDSVLEVYRRIIKSYPIVNQNPRAVAAELGIQGEEDTQTFIELYSSVMVFYPGRGKADGESPHYKLGCGYAIKDLNGDGADELVLLNNEYYIMAIFSYADGKPVLLGNYWERNSCWIDDNGLIHNHGSSGADRSTSAIYKIADGGESLELISEFGTNGHEWIGDVAYTKYYKVVDGEKVSITESEWTALAEQYGKYLGGVAGEEATKQYSGLTFTSLYTEAEIAMEMYEAFLRNEISMEGLYLKNLQEEYLRNYLWERNGSVHYAYVDMDKDGQVELLVRGIDTFVFSYSHENNEVYRSGLYNFRDMNRVYVDGSYSWNTAGGSDGVTYGIEKNGEDIWRLENEGGENPRYYIGDTEVTEEECLKYIEENPRPEEVKFTAISGEGWNKVIGRERAEEIASEYWNVKDGDINEQTGGEYMIYVSGMVDEKYCVSLRCAGKYYDPDIDVLYIDAITGEILTDFLPEDKG